MRKNGHLFPIETGPARIWILRSFRDYENYEASPTHKSLVYKTRIIGLWMAPREVSVKAMAVPRSPACTNQTTVEQH